MPKPSSTTRPTLLDTSLHVPYDDALRFVKHFFDSLYWGGMKKWVRELKPDGKDKPLSYQMVVGLKNGSLVTGQSPNILRRVLLGLGFRTSIMQKKQNDGVNYFMVFESPEALSLFHQQLAEYESSESPSNETGERPQ